MVKDCAEMRGAVEAGDNYPQVHYCKQRLIRVCAYAKILIIAALTISTLM